MNPATTTSSLRRSNSSFAPIPKDQHDCLWDGHDEAKLQGVHLPATGVVDPVHRQHVGLRFEDSSYFSPLAKDRSPFVFDNVISSNSSTLPREPALSGLPSATESPRVVHGADSVISERGGDQSDADARCRGDSTTDPTTSPIIYPKPQESCDCTKNDPRVLEGGETDPQGKASQPPNSQVQHDASLDTCSSPHVTGSPFSSGLDMEDDDLVDEVDESLRREANRCRAQVYKKRRQATSSSVPASASYVEPEGCNHDCKPLNGEHAEWDKENETGNRHFQTTNRKASTRAHDADARKPPARPAPPTPLQQSERPRPENRTPASKRPPAPTPSSAHPLPSSTQKAKRPAAPRMPRTVLPTTPAGPVEEPVSRASKESDEISSERSEPEPSTASDPQPLEESDHPQTPVSNKNAPIVDEQSPVGQSLDKQPTTTPKKQSPGVDAPARETNQSPQPVNETCSTEASAGAPATPMARKHSSTAYHDLVQQGQLTYYEILGVEPDATGKAIMKRFRKLSIATHPDRNKSDSATEDFQALNSIYLTLKVPAKRMAYNCRIGLRNGRGTPKYNKKNTQR